MTNQGRAIILAPTHERARAACRQLEIPSHGVNTRVGSNAGYRSLEGIRIGVDDHVVLVSMGLWNYNLVDLWDRLLALYGPVRATIL